MAYTIIYSDRFKAQMKRLDGFARSRIEAAIERYLRDQPNREGAFRKRLRPNPVAKWSLRVKPEWRVLYNIHNEEVEVELVVLAEKRREKFVIDGQEVEL